MADVIECDCAVVPINSHKSRRNSFSDSNSQSTDTHVTLDLCALERSTGADFNKFKVQLHQKRYSDFTSIKTFDSIPIGDHRNT